MGERFMTPWYHERFPSNLITPVCPLAADAGAKAAVTSDLHNVKTQKINKIALSGDDDKRFICDDGVSTLALGHKNIM